MTLSLTATLNIQSNDMCEGGVLQISTLTFTAVQEVTNVAIRRQRKVYQVPFSPSTMDNVGTCNWELDCKLQGGQKPYVSLINIYTGTSNICFLKESYQPHMA